MEKYLHGASALMMNATTTRFLVAVLYILYALLIILAFFGEIVSLDAAVIICLGLHMTGLFFSLVLLKKKFGWDFTYPFKEKTHIKWKYFYFDCLQGVALLVVIVFASTTPNYAVTAAAAAIALVGVVLCLAKVVKVANDDGYTALHAATTRDHTKVAAAAARAAAVAAAGAAADAAGAAAGAAAAAAGAGPGAAASTGSLKALNSSAQAGKPTGLLRSLRM